MMIFLSGYWEKLAGISFTVCCFHLNVHQYDIGWQSTVFITASYPFWTATTTSNSLSFSSSLYF